MIRRTSMLLAGLAGLLLASGCSTFTDADDVARVGDADLTRDELGDLVGDDPASLEQVFQIGGGPGEDDSTPDGSISSALAGRVISVWMENEVLQAAIADADREVTEADMTQARNLIESTPTFEGLNESFLNLVTEYQAATIVWTDINRQDAEFDPDTARADYEQGMEASGIACLGAIVTPAEDDAVQAVADIRGGAGFTETATEVTVESQTALGCRAPAELQQQLGPDLFDAIAELDVVGNTVSDPVEQPAQDGTSLWIVLGHLPFDEVAGELEALVTQQGQQASQQAAQEALTTELGEADYYVHPRYGTYSPGVGLQPLGQPAPAGDVPTTLSPG